MNPTKLGYIGCFLLQSTLAKLYAVFHPGLGRCHARSKVTIQHMTQVLTVGALTVPRDEAPVHHVGGRKSNQTFSPCSQWTHTSYSPACEGQEESVECWPGDDDDDV